MTVNAKLQKVFRRAARAASTEDYVVNPRMVAKFYKSRSVQDRPGVVLDLLRFLKGEASMFGDTMAKQIDHARTMAELEKRTKQGADALEMKIRRAKTRANKSLKSAAVIAALEALGAKEVT